jgi:hypothetical protein
MKLYMLQTVPLSIIRSFSLYTQQWYMSYSFADSFSSKIRMEHVFHPDLINRCYSWIGHTVRHNELVVNVLEGALSGRKAVGRPGLQYLKQVARNTGADSYTAMERMACNNYRWKAANRSKDWRIRRRYIVDVGGWASECSYLLLCV